jgi:uncharacterized protein YodC (DUF2158 family)
MTKQIFNIGEIVHLNSGSPDLKVVRIDADQVEVTWSDDSGPRRLVLPAVCFHRVA